MSPFPTTQKPLTTTDQKTSTQWFPPTNNQIQMASTSRLSSQTPIIQIKKN